MSRYDRSYFAGRFVAQEAAKASGASAPSEMQLVLPMPPSVNDAWWHVIEKNTVKTVLTDRHRKFRAEVMGIVHGSQRGGNWMTMRGRLTVSVSLHFCDRRRVDIDNRIKPLFDALQAAGAFKDDSQIDVLNVRRAVTPGEPECCRVTITET